MPSRTRREALQSRASGFRPGAAVSSNHGGIDQAVAAFPGVFQGQNLGEMLAELP
jgi:hypothetical protein